MEKQKIYSKIEALDRIVVSAKKYHESLEDKALLLLYKDKNAVKQFQVNFSGANFLHFTGVKTILSPNKFFNAALSGHLRESDFEFKNNELTSKKLDVLEKAVDFPYSAKVIGIYNGPKIKLQADYGAGNTYFVMTFRCDDRDNWLYPVGVQKEDTRSVTNPSSPIIAILTKKNNEVFYENITYKSKNISIEKLHFPKAIRDKLSDEAYHILKPQQTEQLTSQKQVHQEKESEVSFHPGRPSSIAERIAQKQKYIQQRAPVKHTHPHRNNDQEL